MKKLQIISLLLLVTGVGSLYAQQPIPKRVGSIHIIKDGKVYLSKAPQVGPNVAVYKTWQVPAGETTGAGPVQRPYIENGKVNVRKVVGAMHNEY